MKRFCIAFCAVFFAVIALMSAGCSSEHPADTQTVVPVSKHDFTIELNIVGVLMQQNPI